VMVPRMGDRWAKEIENCRAHVEKMNDKHDAALEKLALRIGELENAIRDK